MDDGLRHSQVQTDIAFGVADEKGVAALKQYAGLVGEEVRDILHAGQALGQVNPCKIGSVRDVHDGIRKILRQIILDKAEVAIEVSLQLIEPLLAIIVGRLCRGEGQGVDHAKQLVAGLELGAQLGIADDDVGEAEACHVEGLGRSHAGDELRIGLHDGRHRNVLLAAADQVAVDLIGDDPDIVFLYDLSDAGQFLSGPHAAGGVLRVAPEKQLAVRIGTLALKILIVQIELAIGILLQRRVQDLQIRILGSMEEIAIGRRV